MKYHEIETEGTELGTYRGFTICEAEDGIIAVSPEFPDVLGIRADFAQAADLVEVLDADGEWTAHPNGKQVADFRHDEMAAIEEQIDCYLDEEW